jgi:hypothetical protein
MSQRYKPFEAPGKHPGKISFNIEGRNLKRPLTGISWVAGGLVVV